MLLGVASLIMSLSGAAVLRVASHGDSGGEGKLHARMKHQPDGMPEPLNANKRLAGLGGCCGAIYSGDDERKGAILSDGMVSLRAVFVYKWDLIDMKWKV